MADWQFFIDNGRKAIKIDGMKLKHLHIVNIGIIEDISLDLNKSLMLFYGDIRQGKTSILNSVRWAFGGSFPQDIIRHGQREAFVELTFDNGSIRREWYVAKDQSIKARPIAFVRDGKPVKNPVDEISQFLNPFLLDQDFLRSMGELDRKKYFSQLFGVDTTDLDDEALKVETEAKELRIKLKSYGDIDLTPIEPVDAAELVQKRSDIRTAHIENVVGWDKAIKDSDSAYEAACSQIMEHNRKAAADASARTSAEKRIADIRAEIDTMNSKIIALQTECSTIQGELESSEPLKPSPLPNRPDNAELRAKIAALPDTSELDKQISDAAANNVRHEQYLKNQERAKDRVEDEKALLGFERRLKEIKTRKSRGSRPSVMILASRVWNSMNGGTSPTREQAPEC